jgi:hypothetical protein
MDNTHSVTQTTISTAEHAEQCTTKHVRFHARYNLASSFSCTLLETHSFCAASLNNFKYQLPCTSPLGTHLSQRQHQNKFSPHFKRLTGDAFSHTWQRNIQYTLPYTLRVVKHAVLLAPEARHFQHRPCLLCSVTLHTGNYFYNIIIFLLPHYNVAFEYDTFKHGHRELFMYEALSIFCVAKKLLRGTANF